MVSFYACVGWLKILYIHWYVSKTFYIQWIGLCHIRIRESKGTPCDICHRNYINCTKLWCFFYIDGEMTDVMLSASLLYSLSPWKKWRRAGINNKFIILRHTETSEATLCVIICHLLGATSKRLTAATDRFRNGNNRRYLVLNAICSSSIVLAWCKWTPSWLDANKIPRQKQ